MKMYLCNVFCLLNVAAFSDEIPTAKDMLDKYAQTQDKLSNCIIKSHDSFSLMCLHKTRHQYFLKKRNSGMMVSVSAIYIRMVI